MNWLFREQLLLVIINLDFNSKYIFGGDGNNFFQVFDWKWNFYFEFFAVFSFDL